jgi:hypothetical protein
VVGHVRFPADVEANYVTVSEEAHRWKCLLEEGKYRPAGEIAGAEEVTGSFINRLLRLTSLAPDIVEAISVAGSRRGCWRSDSCPDNQ